ncbi:hypothetical protein M3Y99_01917200 [Aphelenchoides fujianensis]|nr:hypothetical protein M3Y99_01917200 [Aphelenchoides fujianensis]
MTNSTANSSSANRTAVKRAAGVEDEPAIQPKRRSRTVDGQQTPRTPSASFHGPTQSGGHQSRAALSRSHAGAPSVRRVNFGESVRCPLIPADYRRRFRDRHRHQPTAQTQTAATSLWDQPPGGGPAWASGRPAAVQHSPQEVQRSSSADFHSSSASSRSSSASSRSSVSSSRSAPSTTRWEPKLRLPQVNTELYRWNRELRARIKENNQIIQFQLIQKKSYARVMHNEYSKYKWQEKGYVLGKKQREKYKDQLTNGKQREAKMQDENERLDRYMDGLKKKLKDRKREGEGAKSEFMTLEGRKRPDPFNDTFFAGLPSGEFSREDSISGVMGADVSEPEISFGHVSFRVFNEDFCPLGDRSVDL